jgi:hypothetical protein
MKFLSGLLVLFILSSFVPVKEPVLIHRFIVQPSSTLAIDGSTNVNSFQCGISSYIGTDTLILQEGKASQKPIFLRGRVALKASYFDCGMNVMTKDFNQTIKAKQYPHIVIDFKSFERAPDYTRGVEKFKGTMNISLGGTTKQFVVDCTIKPQSSGLIHLSGFRTFLFSDFNLQPPEKMMGLIRIQEELTVRFNLVLLLDKNS